MLIHQQRYRPLAAQQTEQIRINQQPTAQRTQSEPLKLEEAAEYLEGVFQNTFDGQFLNDRNKVVLAVVVVVIIGFYAYLITSLQSPPQLAASSTIFPQAGLNQTSTKMNENLEKQNLGNVNLTESTPLMTESNIRNTIP